MQSGSETNVKTLFQNLFIAIHKIEPWHNSICGCCGTHVLGDSFNKGIKNTSLTKSSTILVYPGRNKRSAEKIKSRDLPERIIKTFRNGGQVLTLDILEK